MSKKVQEEVSNGAVDGGWGFQEAASVTPYSMMQKTVQTYLQSLLTEPATPESLQALEQSVEACHQLLVTWSTSDPKDFVGSFERFQEQVNALYEEQETPPASSDVNLPELAQAVIEAIQERNRPTMGGLLRSLALAKELKLEKVAAHIEEQLLAMVEE